MTLAQGEFGVEYQVVSIDTEDEELNDFLLTLGCYKGEKIVIVSSHSDCFVVSVRDGRYNMDRDLAEAILIAA